MAATTGASSERPEVTSMRPLSMRPVLTARRVTRLSVIVSTKLPSPSDPTAVVGKVSASGCRFQGAVRFCNADIGLGDRRIGAILINHLGGDPLILEEHFVPLQRDIL